MVFDIDLMSDRHYKYWEVVSGIGKIQYSTTTVYNRTFQFSLDEVLGEGIVTSSVNSRGVTAKSVLSCIGLYDFKELIERFIEFGVYSHTVMLPSEMVVETPTDGEIAVRVWDNRKRKLEAAGL